MHGAAAVASGLADEGVRRGPGGPPHGLWMVLALVAIAPAAGAEFSGASAYEFTKRVVELGPRTPASPGMRRQQTIILNHLKPVGCEITEDDFTASTPLGALAMKNILCRFRGTSGQAIVFTGHYDTKIMPEIRFVGANDAGSSTGFLMEMARVLAKQPRKHDVYLVWLDGEEAIRQWSRTDGVYGSRHLAERWKRDGTLGRIRALVNVDMIGDRDLRLIREMNSTRWLREQIWQIGRELSFGKHFGDEEGHIEDDHVPFLRLGVPALDLIDFNYGPGHEWWHSEDDTMDKLSPGSFEVVGKVLLEFLRRQEQ